VILVTGATGNIGRELVKQLLDEGQKVAAVTRDPSSSKVPAGAQVVAGDLASPAALAPVLETAEALFINFAATGRGTRELLSLAPGHGVQRVVLLSGLAAQFGGTGPLAGQFKAMEGLVKDSGLAWTFVRAGEFAANALAWVPQIRQGGVVYGAYAESATAPIHERDIAAVAAKALISPDHAGQVYTITGPESITQRGKVQIIGEAAGKELRFQEIPREQALAAMTSHGFPEPVADELLGYQATSVTQPTPLTGTVAEVLGRPALTFAQWATDHAAAFGG
jgi:uncharacterized protein YbjT (DUF2867 family)